LPWPYSSAVIPSISRMPGPPLGPFVADDDHVAGRVRHGLHGLQAVLFDSKTRAGPAVLQPLQARDFQQRAVRARLPLSTTTPPVGAIALPTWRTTSPSGSGVPFSSWARVRPVR
jgi:hypothetical protein